MFDFTRIEELQKIAMKSIDQLNQQIDNFDVFLNESIKNAAENDRQVIEQMRSVAQQAFNLAKMGKADEARELIENFQNERQGN